MSPIVPLRVLSHARPRRKLELEGRRGEWTGGRDGRRRRTAEESSVVFAPECEVGFEDLDTCLERSAGLGHACEETTVGVDF